MAAHLPPHLHCWLQPPAWPLGPAVTVGSASALASHRQAFQIQPQAPGPEGEV